MKKKHIKIYTDGSCHTQKKIGTWAALILMDEKKSVIHGSEQNTTHQRMELLAILEAIKFIRSKGLEHEHLAIYTDSQYAFRLKERQAKLESNDYLTKKGNAIRNEDLVKELLFEQNHLELEFHKVKAHQKEGDHMNREVDVLVRNELRRLIHT